MNLSEQKESIKHIIDTIPRELRPGFCEWLKQYAEDISKEMLQSNADVIIGAIQEDLRQVLPVNAVLNSEQILPSKCGPNADCDPRSTVHVDSFLYSEEIVDQLCEVGKMSRNYCVQCGCRQVAPLTFLSHSSSLTQLRYMFEHLLPDLRGKTLLDVGSRTGAVLYTAYYYSAVSKIIGVELNEEFCKVQQNIIDKYQLSDRVMIVHSDVCNQKEILQTADVIVMNNVFEFFAPADIQQRVWQYLHTIIRRSGVLLITSPSLEESLAPLQTGIDLLGWITKLNDKTAREKANVVFWGSKNSEDSDLDDIHLYQVL